MTMITPSYLGETIEYSSLHACRSTLEDPTDAARLQTIEIHANKSSAAICNTAPSFHLRGKAVAKPGARLDIPVLTLRIVKRLP